MFYKDWLEDIPKSMFCLLLFYTLLNSDTMVTVWTEEYAKLTLSKFFPNKTTL